MSDPDATQHDEAAGVSLKGGARRVDLSTAWDGPNGSRRRAIYVGLQRIGRTPADLWHDACLVLTDGRFATSTHLVGHALREIDGTLLDLLAPDDLIEGDGGDSRRAKIEWVGESLALDPALTSLWSGIPFHGLAHRRQPQPRPKDQGFQDLFDQYSLILEAVVAAFERRFNQWMSELDELLQVESPSKSDLRRLTAGVPLSLDPPIGWCDGGAFRVEGGDR
jgi:hypothetical protein